MMPMIFTRFADACSGGSLLAFPTWHAYLVKNSDCVPRITGIGDVWLIAAAILDILLRLAAIAAIIFIVYGGFEFITSQGEPEKISRARGTVINAVVGLVISIAATAVVTFIAGRIK